MESSTSRRRNSDLVSLHLSSFKVEMLDSCGKCDFVVLFDGPHGTPYEAGVWKVRVELPSDYPFRSPSIGFMNRIFHPNIDELSGSVCLDVINQTWSPMYDLVNIFSFFLPQLLRYPNPADPLNGEAAALLLSNPDDYAAKVREYITKYAQATNENKKNSRGKDLFVQEAVANHCEVQSDASDISDSEHEAEQLDL